MFKALQQSRMIRAPHVASRGSTSPPSAHPPILPGTFVPWRQAPCRHRVAQVVAVFCIEVGSFSSFLPLFHEALRKYSLFI